MGQVDYSPIVGKLKRRLSDTVGYDDRRRVWEEIDDARFSAVVEQSQNESESRRMRRRLADLKRNRRDGQKYLDAAVSSRNDAEARRQGEYLHTLDRQIVALKSLLADMGGSDVETK